MALDSAQYRVTLRSIILVGAWLRILSYGAELDFRQYDTAWSFPLKFGCLTPRSIILCGAWLCAVSYFFQLGSAEYHTAQSQAQWLYDILRSAQYHTARSLTPRNIILHRVKLHSVWYCPELTLWSIILRRVKQPNLRGKLRAVSYCEESSSAQYDSTRSHSVLHGVNSHFLKLLHRPFKGQCHKNKYKFRLY